MYHPDVMMFAEENTSWPKLTHKIEDGGLGFDFKWNMGWMNDMLHYMSLNSMWRPFNHDSLTFSFYYAFSEKFLLPISHDEVSHGKGSLIKQMPGKYDEQFAGVRAFITYMYAHPGKKLVFMGTEIGQFDEWNHEEAIQWDLLEFEKHKKLRTFLKSSTNFILTASRSTNLTRSGKALTGFTMTITQTVLLHSSAPTKTVMKLFRYVIFSPSGVTNTASVFLNTVFMTRFSTLMKSVSAEAVL